MNRRRMRQGIAVLLEQDIEYGFLLTGQVGGEFKERVISYCLKSGRVVILCG